MIRLYGKVLLSSKAFRGVSKGGHEVPRWLPAEETLTNVGFRRWKEAHGREGAIMKQILSTMKVQ